MTENIGQHIVWSGMSVTDDELQWLYNAAIGMESVVEIGSFHGRSTYALLKACNGVVYSVDNDHDNSKAILRDNLKNFSNVVFHELDSVEASKEFEDDSIDMIFIDGDHSYSKVKQDIQAWFPKIRKVICGHDYNNSHPGVMRSVNELFGSNFTLYNNIWCTRKDTV